MRTPDAVLFAYLTNLNWAIDAASLKLARLRRGTSAWKTQSGYLRGLIDAKAALDAEMGSALYRPHPVQNEP